MFCLILKNILLLKTLLIGESLHVIEQLQRKDYETNITEIFSNLNICDDVHCTNDPAAHIDDVYNRFVEAFHYATILNIELAKRLILNQF